MIYRFMLASDIHYTTDLSPAQMKAQYPNATASVASGNAFGYTQREKIDMFRDAVVREMERKPIDALLFLGDLSIDDYEFRNLPDNYCLKFKTECLDTLPCPYYVIPGNHDSYPNSQWVNIFGTNRQHTVQVGPCVFIMLDTFAATPAHDAAGAPITPIDEVYLQTMLEQYKGNHIFICAHHLEDKIFTDSLLQTISRNADVRLLFRGHTHINGCERVADKTLVDIGGYAYNGMCIDGRWDFSVFDHSWAWGYQILEIDDTITTYHVKPALTYKASNGEFLTKDTIENYMQI